MFKKKSKKSHNSINGKHFNGKRFVNTTGPFVEHTIFSGARMWFGTRKMAWPKQVQNTIECVPPLNLAKDQFAITWINHATFLIQIAGFNILTDPMWSERASPFKSIGPKRVRDAAIKIADLPKIDLVLISHNHYDHLDVATLKSLNQHFAPTVVVALGDLALVKSLGIKNVFEMDWWQTLPFGEGLNITFAPTQHFSARGLFDYSASLWGSYIIKSDKHKIYFGGDAGYSEHYKEIYQREGCMDVALLGIGAYEPRWFMRYTHTNPEEAVLAHMDLHAKQSIGMHFGTFQLSAEGIDQPLIDLASAVTKHKLPTNSFITLEVGQTQIYPNSDVKG